MDDDTGTFVTVTDDGSGDGSEERQTRMRYEAFRERYGFCVSYWTIARPGAVLDAATVKRWGLVGPKPLRIPRIVVQLFLAGPADDSDDFEAGRYYASFELSGAARWQPVALHALTADNLRLIVAWAKHVKKEDRAPSLSAGDSMVATLNAVDEFCVAHVSTVIGPRT